MVQRGNVRIPNIVFINAAPYALENGCKWRALPKRFAVYAPFHRWSQSGVLAGRMEHQDPHGLGKWPSSNDFSPVRREFSPDAPEGRVLLESWDEPAANAPLAMDRACEGDETRRLVVEMGMTLVVPPKANRKVKWDYDRETYKFRNEVERLFWRIKGYRHI